LEIEPAKEGAKQVRYGSGLLPPIGGYGGSPPGNFEILIQYGALW